MFRKLLVTVLALAAAVAIGAGVGIGVWETVDSDPEATTVTATPTERVADPGDNLSVNEIYERAKDGVVHITRGGSEPTLPFQPPDGEATGSGFVIDGEGRIVTNQHVVQGAQRVQVRFADGEEYDARVVGVDASTDVALLQLANPPADLKPLELGSSESLEIGDLLVAIGSPFGLQGTVTTGIVSALDRELTAPDGFTIDGAIQTDAAINPGNSGGPLLDGQGRVVGINSQIATETGGNVGIGYAVPIETAKEVVEALRAGRAPERPYLGVRLADDDAGGRIVEVTEGSPAAAAGLEVGDVIVEIGGEAVEGADEVRRAVAERDPGDELELTIERNGDRRDVTAELGTRPTQ